MGYFKNTTAKSVVRFDILNLTSAEALIGSAFLLPVGLWWAVHGTFVRCFYLLSSMSTCTVRHPMLDIIGGGFQILNKETHHV